MGKRTKKKVQSSISGRTASALKVSSLSLSASTSSPSEGGCPVDTSSDARFGSGCTHGPNLEKLRSQLAKSNGIHCIGCSKLRCGVSSGKDRKGRAKVVRKKPASPLVAVDDKNGSHKLWICLSCGHVGCGLGNSKLTANALREVSRQIVKQGLVGRGHAWQHWLQLKHPVVMLCEENFPSWCFVCEQAHEMNHVGDVPSQSQNQPTGEAKHDASASLSRALLLHELEALVREKLSEGRVGVESGQLTKTLEKEDGLQSSVNVVGHEETVRPPSRRVMKGLMNLGNTCFFNSVMQNLLSVEVLRRHFESPSPAPEGVLTASLRKFFQDASARSLEDIDGALEIGIKKGVRARAGLSSIDGTYNPKSLFSAICLKAPRFKGSQQQDSHELFKTLLDLLHGEEETSIKAASRSGAGKEALRALSKSEETISLAQTGDRDDALPEDTVLRGESDTVLRGESATELMKYPTQPETFVERVFGGQLSSTVTCCECGHSSMKYESFLDLSLPIPPTKLPKNGSASEIQTSGVQTRSQRVQTLRNSKGSNKTDPDLDIFRSVPAGLGTPLLLLPPPPLKEDKVYGAGAEPASEDTWLDYLGPVTEPTETERSDFVDVGFSVPSVCSVDRCSRPTPESSPRLESETTQSSVATLDSTDFGTSFTADSKTTTQEFGALQFDCNEIAPGDVVRSSVEFEQKLNFRATTSYAMASGNAVDQILDTPYLEKMSPLQGAPGMIGDDKNADRGLRPMLSHGGDVRVLMRGGSTTAGFDSTHDSELNSFVAVAEQSNGTGVSLEELENWNAHTEVPSDIIEGANGPIILLGGLIVDDNVAATGANAGSDGEFDGVDALFTEVETVDEGQVYGPALPSHPDELGLDESAYEDVIFHDVLDLSKISIEGKTDWLVSHEEKDGEENDGRPVSVESCLQTFTKSELLSGENAWECDNCAQRSDMLAAAVGTMSPLIDEEEAFNERGMEESASTSPEREPSEPQDDEHSNGNMSATVLLSNTPEKMGQCVVNIGIENEPSGAGESVHSCDTSMSSSSPPSSTSRGGEANPKVVERDQTSQQQRSDSDNKVGNCTSRSVLEPLDMNKLETRVEPSENEDTGYDVITSSIVQAKDPAGADKKAITTDLSIATNVTAKETIAGNVADPRNHGNYAKSKRAKQEKVTAERKTVIKRDATKQFLIGKAPLVLTIQLKRFAQDMRGRLSKLSGHVAFQEFLDLRPFLDHRSVNSDFTYRLVGVVEHAGTLKSGHYVAFVRGPPASGPSAPKLDKGSSSSGLSSWYHISDEQVRPTTLEAVLQREAYLVFYERVDGGNGFR